MKCQKLEERWKALSCFVPTDIFIIDCGEYLYPSIMNITRGIWGVRDINTHSFDIHGYQHKVWKLHVSQYARTKYLKKVKSHQIIWQSIHAIFLSNFLSHHTAEKSTSIKTNSQGCRCFTSKIGFFSVQVYYKFQTSDFNKHLPPSQHTAVHTKN